MLTQITSVQDMHEFARQLIHESTSFHPDDDFRDYIVLESGAPAYTPEEAALRNNLMEQCFALCDRIGESIYDHMNTISLIETGANKFIPLALEPELLDKYSLSSFALAGAD